MHFQITDKKGFVNLLRCAVQTTLNVIFFKF